MFPPSMPIHLLFYRFFFFNDTAPTEIYTLSLHDALPIYLRVVRGEHAAAVHHEPAADPDAIDVLRRRVVDDILHGIAQRSEEHTSELQSRQYLVCRLLLEKKKIDTKQAAR